MRESTSSGVVKAGDGFGPLACRRFRHRQDGLPRKVVGASCVAVTDFGEEGQAGTGALAGAQGNQSPKGGPKTSHWHKNS